MDAPDDRDEGTEKGSSNTSDIFEAEEGGKRIGETRRQDGRYTNDCDKEREQGQGQGQDQDQEHGHGHGHGYEYQREKEQEKDTNSERRESHDETGHLAPLAPQLKTRNTSSAGRVGSAGLVGGRAVGGPGGVGGAGGAAVSGSEGTMRNELSRTATRRSLPPVSEVLKRTVSLSGASVHGGG
jgi:hypothetical protein